jgi:hypothetical protein
MRKFVIVADRTICPLYFKPCFVSAFVDDLILLHEFRKNDKPKLQELNNGAIKSKDGKAELQSVPKYLLLQLANYYHQTISDQEHCLARAIFAVEYCQGIKKSK